MLKCHLYFFFVSFLPIFDNQYRRYGYDMVRCEPIKTCERNDVTLMLLCGSFYFERSLFANNLNGNKTQMPSLSLSTQPYENKPAAINTSQHSSLNWCLLFILTRKHTHTYIHFKYYHAKTINE